MVREVRIYVEGGGNDKTRKAQVRRGFSTFLNCFNRKAKIIACGSRNDTGRNFSLALDTHPNAFNILLVDAEDRVREGDSPRQHLQHRDNWNLPNVNDEQCHLMVQMMEAWLIADLAVLREFYGQGFNPNSLPKNQNVEDIPKQRLEAALKTATRNTSKGEYHKIKHGPMLLGRLNVDRVRQTATHCDRLFNTLARQLDN